jgi:hypothetical protein
MSLRNKIISYVLIIGVIYLAATDFAALSALATGLYNLLTLIGSIIASILKSISSILPKQAS